MRAGCATLLSVTICLWTSLASAMPEIEIIEVFNIDGLGNHAIDVFYTPSPGAEFNAWDLIVTPSHGGILDPKQFVRSDDTTDGAEVDTWANTVASSIGAGAASYIFSAYDPGSIFPPGPPFDPLPSAGGNPDRLSWTIFDIFTGDGVIPGLTPYHMARIMYSQGGGGTIEVRMFENLQPADVPFVANRTYGIPEPSSFFLLVLGLNLLPSRRQVW